MRLVPAACQYNQVHRPKHSMAESTYSNTGLPSSFSLRFQHRTAHLVPESWLTTLMSRRRMSDSMSVASMCLSLNCLFTCTGDRVGGVFGRHFLVCAYWLSGWTSTQTIHETWFARRVCFPWSHVYAGEAVAISLRLACTGGNESASKLKIARVGGERKRSLPQTYWSYVLSRRTLAPSFTTACLVHATPDVCKPLKVGEGAQPSRSTSASLSRFSHHDWLDRPRSNDLSTLGDIDTAR